MHNIHIAKCITIFKSLISKQIMEVKNNNKITVIYIIFLSYTDVAI